MGSFVSSLLTVLPRRTNIQTSNETCHTRGGKKKVLKVKVKVKSFSLGDLGLYHITHSERKKNRSSFIDADDNNHSIL